MSNYLEFLSKLELAQQKKNEFNKRSSEAESFLKNLEKQVFGFLKK